LLHGSERLSQGIGGVAIQTASKRDLAFPLLRFQAIVCRLQLCPVPAGQRVQGFWLRLRCCVVSINLDCRFHVSCLL
jgi:hypothetical protein